MMPEIMIPPATLHHWMILTGATAMIPAAMIRTTPARVMGCPVEIPLLAISPVAVIVLVTMPVAVVNPTGEIMVAVEVAAREEITAAEKEISNGTTK
jgi:hypothetical protein